MIDLASWFLAEHKGQLTKHVLRLQVEAAEREELFKGHMAYLEQRRERELEREREREKERELEAEEAGEKRVRCADLRDAVYWGRAVT